MGVSWGSHCFFVMQIEHRILIVDDDEDILELLSYNLCKEGYIIHGVHESAKTVDVALAFQPALIILDAVMPDEDGFEVCRKLRSQTFFSQTYIFILTNLVESQYEELAFKSGADEFIHKMLGVRSLLKRIELVLRKKIVIKKRHNNLQVGSWLLNRSSHCIWLKEKRILLSQEEFELVYFLAQNTERSITISLLEDVLSGSNLFQMNTSIETCIGNLVHKLGRGWISYPHKKSLRFIVT